jgi:hypothetical protein
MGHGLNRILGDIEVNEVGQGRVGGEGFSTRDPHIWMLGLEYLTDRIPGFLVSVLGIKDSSFLSIRQISDGPSDVAAQHFLVESLSSLHGGGVALLESQVSLHGS